jgi:hypothetical protein
VKKFSRRMVRSGNVVGSSKDEKGKPVVLCVRAVFVGVISLVVIIERQHLVLPVSSRKHIGGVAVIALVELLEKTKSSGNATVIARVKIQVEPLRQFKQSFPPFARGNRTENRAYDYNPDK